MIMDVQKSESLRVHIRWLIRRDYPEFFAIENAAFEFPWDEATLIRCLRHKNCIGMVAEHDGRIVGYMVYELHKTRLHILNFAVDQRARRCGVGTAMLDKLKSKLGPNLRRRITLEVRETNLAAQVFFRSQGFRAVNILKDWYDDTPEDAIVFQHKFVGDRSSIG